MHRPSPAILSRAFVLLLAAATFGVFAWTLGDLTIDRAADAGPANLDALRPFWAIGAGVWTLLTLVWWTHRADDVGSRRRFLVAAATVLVVAGLARAWTIHAHAPALSDDVYRYVADARALAHGVNPYHPVPAERLRALGRGAPPAWPGEADLLARVNNADLPTIYLPGTQVVFGLVGRAIGERRDVESGVDVMRGTLAGLDLLVIGLILVTLRMAARSPWLATLYAWHPLPLTEIAGSGHQDVIGLALLLIAMIVVTRSPRHLLAWTVPFAAAVAVKPVVLPLWPFLLRRRAWCRWTISAALGAATLLVLSAPFFLFDGGAALANLWSSVSRFSLKWAHFGSVYESALALTESLLPSWSNDPQERLARGVGLAVLLVVWIIVWRRRTALFPAARTLLFTMVLCSAAAHPWYLLWALMLIPRTGGLAPWVASLTISWGYLALGDPAGWTMPAGAAWAAWTPVYLAVVVDVLRSRRRAATMGADGEVPPGPAIGACVADLRECP